MPFEETKYRLIGRSDRWTTSDEDAFQQMAARRDSVRTANLGALREALVSVLSEPSDKQVELFVLNADRIRDALQPFDSGVRFATATPRVPRDVNDD